MGTKETAVWQGCHGRGNRCEVACTSSGWFYAAKSTFEACRLPVVNHSETSVATLPKSATSFRINLVALACLLTGFWVLNGVSQTFFEITGNPADAATLELLFLLATWSAPVIVLERLFQKRGWQFSRQRLSISRALTKVLGFYVTLAVCGLTYWIFPEYHGSFYEPYWNLLRWLALPVLIGCIPYFYFIDGFFEKPEDGYFAVGRLLLAAQRPARPSAFSQHALGWLVKLFFLPLMTVYLQQATVYLASVDLQQGLTGFIPFYDLAWQVIFAVDLAVVTAGYLLALRLLDAHIRSSESTVGGWLVALICYQPFWSAISVGYLAYNKDNYSWGNWLAGNDLATMLWGSAILVLITIYSLSSVAFGIRFSNLTHRGVITSGPYRLTKHPAYLSKNLSWWLIAVPFIATPNNWLDAVQACCMLIGLNLIYLARAITEERHLSWDPTYRSYQAALATDGLFPRFERLVSEFGKKKRGDSGHRVSSTEGELNVTRE